MDKFLLSENYRLELHWGKVNYMSNNTCILENAYFSGPVLRIAEKINSNEFIMLDFTKQYYVLVSNYYIVKLSWEEAITREDNVTLKNVVLTYDEHLDTVHKLRYDDYLVIDTKGHDLEEHYLNLVYYSYVINKDGVLYSFGRE